MDAAFSPNNYGKSFSGLSKFPTLQENLNSPIKVPGDGFPMNSHYMKQRLDRQREDMTTVNFMKLVDDMKQKKLQ
jgi:hypothetical protein